MSFESAVIEFYRNNARPLPWRKSKDPYFVLVSEMMLQQTRVETVIPYFERFLKAFPDVKALSNAKEEEVLKLWEGLGYYSRAKNLRKSAQKICLDYGGEFPKRKEELLALPGIGEYTASAIASFCFDAKEVPVDGNFLRVYSRLEEYGENVLANKAKADCAAYFQMKIEDHPGLFNEAIMEIGEVICLPLSPRCADCPIRQYCLSHKNDTVSSYPIRERKKERKSVPLTPLVFHCHDEYGYQKRGEGGLLASVYGFPMLEGRKGEEEIKDHLLKEGIDFLSLRFLKPKHHLFSHIRWDLFPVLIEVGDKAEIEGLSFMTLQQRKQRFPLPSAFALIEGQLE